jgi:hypothetical protein
MYLYDRRLTGPERGREERGAALRTSRRFLYPEEAPQNPFSQFSYPFGEAVAAPKGLMLLDHFHSPQQPHPTIAGRFITGPTAKLDVKAMNPGFIDNGDQLITDTSANGLQTCLRKLITTQFQNYLGARQSGAPSAGDRLRVALVDLTGDKITRPDFAGWGSTVPIYGASAPKILALYAAYQLRRDLRELATAQKITNGKNLEAAAIQRWKLGGIKSGFPNLFWLFDIRNWSGTPNALNFTAAARKVFQGIMHNAEAGELIIKVGFPYIASVTWQSGLYHPTRSGLWLTSSYGKGQWGGNPVKGAYSANITALSAATYFTLLAQGRLTDNASSNEIRAWLLGGCVTGLFPDGLGVVASKCGIWSDYLHDCALIVRGGIRYVVAGLTRTKPGEFSKYTQLFTELDRLIVRNNQTPKPSCQ